MCEGGFISVDLDDLIPSFCPYLMKVHQTLELGYLAPQTSSQTNLCLRRFQLTVPLKHSSYLMHQKDVNENSSVTETLRERGVTPS